MFLSGSKSSDAYTPGTNSVHACLCSIAELNRFFWTRRVLRGNGIISDKNQARSPRLHQAEVKRHQVSLDSGGGCVCPHAVSFRHIAMLCVDKDVVKIGNQLVPAWPPLALPVLPLVNRYIMSGISVKTTKVYANRQYLMSYQNIFSAQQTSW